jgi:hypothetical protein
MPAFPLARGSGRLAGVLTHPARSPRRGGPPAVLQDSSTYLLTGSAPPAWWAPHGCPRRTATLLRASSCQEETEKEAAASVEETEKGAAATVEEISHLTGGARRLG